MIKDKVEVWVGIAGKYLEFNRMEMDILYDITNDISFSGYSIKDLENICDVEYSDYEIRNAYIIDGIYYVDWENK